MEASVSSAPIHAVIQERLTSSQLKRLLVPVVPLAPLLHGLSSVDLATLTSMMKLLSFREGEQLFQVGEAAQYFGVVLSGRLKAAIPHGERWPGASVGDRGTLQEWRLLSQGEVVGEMALFSGLRRTAAVVALSPGWLATVRFSALDGPQGEHVRAELAGIAMLRLGENQAASTIAAKKHGAAPPGAATAPSLSQPPLQPSHNDDDERQGGSQQRREAHKAIRRAHSATARHCSGSGAEGSTAYGPPAMGRIESGKLYDSPTIRPQVAPPPCISPPTSDEEADERVVQPPSASSYGSSHPGPPLLGRKPRRTQSQGASPTASAASGRKASREDLRGSLELSTRSVGASPDLLRRDLEARQRSPTSTEAGGDTTAEPSGRGRMRRHSVSGQEARPASSTGAGAGWWTRRPSLQVTSAELSQQRASDDSDAARGPIQRRRHTIGVPGGGTLPSPVCANRPADPIGAADADADSGLSSAISAAVSRAKVEVVERRRAAELADGDGDGPRQALRVFCGTWNLNGRPCNDQDISSWLALHKTARQLSGRLRGSRTTPQEAMPDRAGVPIGHNVARGEGPGAPPDVVCLGCQEFVALKLDSLLLPENRGKAMHFERVVLAMLSHLHGCRYTAVRTDGGGGGEAAPLQLVGLLLCVFVREELAPHVRCVASENVKTGLGGVVGNKGAVALRFELHGESLCFITAHLPSGSSAEKKESRNTAMRGVLRALAASFASASPAPLPPPLEHSGCWLLGDLNYRLTLPGTEVRWRVWCRDWRALLMSAQLSAQLRGEPGATTYEAFHEAEIDFKPTYKFDIGTNSYDTSEKRRAPAWTDRVLWAGSATIGPLLYDSAASITSDHKPVRAFFTFVPHRREPGRDRLELLQPWPRARRGGSFGASRSEPWIGKR